MDSVRLDFTIQTHGDCRVPSPMTSARFVRDDQKVLYASTPDELTRFRTASGEPAAMECAGPRERLFYTPASIACGIVTCGGLCPGLNDVIRAIVLSLHHHYGVPTIYGFRHGYEGLVERHGYPPIELTPSVVSRVHEMGGSLLGSSRGPQEPAAMVDYLQRLGVSILFAIGGDGTLRGAQAVADEAMRRRAGISVIGVPKTIDNDISFVQKTFGFETAVAEARRATYAANAEAESARNGIGLVKLMGRDSGFIAAYTVLVDGQVNFCLIPEVPFTLEKLLSELHKRIERRGHAVIVVAEGAGQELLARVEERDASGNIKHGDIGVFLRDAIAADFRDRRVPVSVKYIDPSYTIRSVPASPHDSAFCLLLGHNAVHAGMTGRTGLVVGFWNHQFTHVPINLAVSRRKKVDPDSTLWSSVLASTGQPRDLC
ncbi:MAG TPA: ATP-dependent 6-phosphofructokinase [Vicinamibacterales bacterium]|jgi:6-phosphofructokinase 1